MIRNKGKQEENRTTLKNDTEKGYQARGEQKKNEFVHKQIITEQNMIIIIFMLPA